MIALTHYMRSLRKTASLAFVIVTTPTALVVWSITKTLSLVLPRKIGNVGDELFYEMYQRTLLFLFEELTGVQIHFYGDIPDNSERENAVVIFNHQCTSDWIMASSLGLRSGSVGIVRYVLKESLKKIPFYGFYLKQHGCIYVNRENFLESSMKKQMEQYLHKKYWMVIFPEGTRYNPQVESVLKKSQEYAIANELEPLSQVLTPRSKGFEMCLQNLPDLKHVYDVTIMYGDTVKLVDGQPTRVRSPSLFDLLKGNCRNIHINIDKIATETIPSESDKLKTWLHDRFLIKDRMMTEFYDAENNSKYKSGQLLPLGISSTLPSFLFFLGLNTILLSTKTGRKIYLASVICGSLVSVSTVVFKK